MKRAPRWTNRRTAPTRDTNALATAAKRRAAAASDTSASTSETSIAHGTSASASEITVPASEITAPASVTTTAPDPDNAVSGWFTPNQNRRLVRLPGNTYSQQGPGIAKSHLHATLPLDWEKLDTSNAGHPQAIRDHYARVKFAPLDGPSELTVDEFTGDGDPEDSFKDLAACNNCLVSAGDKIFLDSDEVYYSMRRLIARTQTQPDAFLGPIAGGNWWIAPPVYTLRLEQKGHGTYNTATNYIGDPRVAEFGLIFGDRSGDQTSFEAAMVTVHLVQSGANRSSHFSMLVHHVPTGNTWYMDSGEDGEIRSDLADAEFQRWLQNAGFEIGSSKTPPARHEYRQVPTQNDDWTCGLHSLMNALVFVRFGVFGWDQVRAWNDADSAMEALKTSLHLTLGVQYPPVPSRRTREVRYPHLFQKTRGKAAARKATRAPKPIQPTKPTKPTKPPKPTNKPATPAKKMPPNPPTKIIPKVDPKYEAIRLATCPGGTNPNAPTPDMLREPSSSPDLPSTTRAASTSRAPPLAPTGGPGIPVRHKTRTPPKRPRPEEPVIVPSFDDVMDLDDDADDDQSPLQRRANKRQRSDVTPTRTAKRRRTEAAVTPPGRRTEAVVLSDDDDDDFNDESARSTLSTPPSAKRQRRRVVARHQAQMGRRVSFRGVVADVEGEGDEAEEAGARVARVIGGLWDERGGRREGVESRYAAAPRGVWRGGGLRRLVRGGRRRGGLLEG